MDARGQAHRALPLSLERINTRDMPKTFKDFSTSEIAMHPVRESETALPNTYLSR